MFYWVLAAMSLAGSMTSIAFLIRKSRRAPLSMMATGVLAFYFFVHTSVFVVSGGIVSLLVIELGLISCVLAIRAEDEREQARHRRKIAPRVVRIHPAAYHLSDSGVWRLHRPVEYLSESGVWRQRGQSRPAQM